MTQEILNRFDFEQKLMNCWNVVEDMKLLYNTEGLTEDEKQNFLLGLVTIYQVKFEDMFSAFETLVRERKL